MPLYRCVVAYRYQQSYRVGLGLLAIGLVGRESNFGIASEAMCKFSQNDGRATGVWACLKSHLYVISIIKKTYYLHIYYRS